MNEPIEPRWPIVEEHPWPYIQRGVSLPAVIRESLILYATRGVKPGGFLQAVLRNDLQDAVVRADDDNLVAMPAIVCFVFNCLPSTCWGNAKKVRDHVKLWFGRTRSWDKCQRET